MAERLPAGFPQPVRWEKPATTDVPKDYSDEALLLPLSDEEMRVLESTGPIHAECRWCGASSQPRHPAGVYSSRWYCYECGRFQNEANDR